jgi:hypothetical protein
MKNYQKPGDNPDLHRPGRRRHERRRRSDRRRSSSFRPPRRRPARLSKAAMRRRLREPAKTAGVAWTVGQVLYFDSATTERSRRRSPRRRAAPVAPSPRRCSADVLGTRQAAEHRRGRQRRLSDVVRGPRRRDSIASQLFRHARRRARDVYAARRTRVGPRYGHLRARTIELAKGTAEAGVESLGPAVFVRLARPSDRSSRRRRDHDDSRRRYRVIEDRPDGMGGVVLVLRKKPELSSADVDSRRRS